MITTATPFVTDEAAYEEWHDSHVPTSLAALLDTAPIVEARSLSVITSPSPASTIAATR